MSLFGKIFGKKDATEVPSPVAAPAPPPTPAVPPTDLQRLLAIGTPKGPTDDEAVALFRGIRQTADEGRAVEQLAIIASQRTLPDSLLVAIAQAVVERGAPDGALRLLERTTSGAALLMRADLVADAGDVPSALALVERVLLRSFDHPGARERYARWREALGLVEGRRDVATQTVVAAEPDAPYQLLREVARGGAGAVYEAEDRELGRRIALKIYHEATRDRAQLLHEARVAIELAGPGVIRVFDLDPDHGWIALEWAPLHSIRERIRAQDASARSWALPLAIALARVHDARWVHLDLKPANVLMLAEGTPVLADFGTARRSGEPSPPGSLGYVSPERMAGRAADPRDDVYGFGRILEDALDTHGDDPAILALAHECTGPDANRPVHARELVTRLRAL